MSRAFLTFTAMSLGFLGTMPGVIGAEEPEETRQRHIVRVGGPCSLTSRPEFDDYHHDDLDSLLKHFVDERGLVAYQAWKGDRLGMECLHRYLCSLGAVDPRKGSRAARLTFYINAYNALTLWGILQEYPVASIQLLNRPDAAFRIFDDLQLWVGARYLSLNDIEHNILRPMKEPRIHFALVCAARGCPRLRNEAYRTHRLEQQLTDNTVDFFRDRKRFRLSALRRIIWLSPLLRWYGKDFGSTPQEIVEAILPYLPCQDRDQLQGGPCWEVAHLGYDWSLNDRFPTCTVGVARIAFVVFAHVEPIYQRYFAGGGS